jgi:hypothetical protein
VPAGNRPAQGIVGSIGSGSEAAALLEPRRILRQLSELREKPTLAKVTARSRLCLVACAQAKNDAQKLMAASLFVDWVLMSTTGYPQRQIGQN